MAVKMAVQMAQHCWRHGIRSRQERVGSVDADPHRLRPVAPRPLR